MSSTNLVNDIPETIQPNEQSASTQTANQCNPELQAKLLKFLEKKKQGINLNDNLKCHKDFSNPELLGKIVTHFNIKSEYGTNYPPNVWDPTSINEIDYYDRISKLHSNVLHILFFITNA